MSIVAKKIMMGSGATVDLPSDDQFNRTSFLSHFDGANNGVNNAFDDSSTSNHTVTANGDVTQGSFGPFARPDGEWGVSFDGNGDTLSAPASSDFSPGTGNFTLEAFVNLGIAGSSIAWHQNNSSGAQVNLTGSTTLNANQWYHIAVVINSNTLKLYVDGTSDGSVTNNEVFNNNDVLTIGGNADHIAATNSMGFVNKGATGGSNNKWFLYFAGAGSGITFKGHISNLRFVKGTAVYTGDFTAPTSKLTAITNTKLLTCQSNRFVDNSASGHTITPAGNVAVTAFGPFLTSSVYDATVNGASAYFDGSGDYLSISSSADFALGTGDFTVEFFVYHAALPSATTYFDYRSSQPQAVLYLWLYGPTGAIQLHINGTTRAFTPPSMLGRWAHIAIARSSGTTKTFVDGTEYLSFSDSTDYIQGSTFTISKFFNGDENVNGYICDFRWVKGTAVYTSAFTPPTAPLTAITNTKLLLNMADGQAIDSAAQNNLTLYGTAKTSTAQKKFGTASLLLDGNSDYAYLHNRNNLSGPFCIEAWGWADNLPSAGCTLWCLGTYKIQLQVTNDTVRIYRVGTAEGYINFFTGGEFSVDTWHHVAIVRDTSNVIKCYLNGTASGTTVTDATAFLATSGIFIIGAEADGDPVNQNVLDPWDGYIDDFRISNFARYTSNFTAPTEPFADKGQ